MKTLPSPSSPDPVLAKENAVYQSDNMTLREMSYARQGGNPRHAHEETHLIYFLRGTVEETRKRETLLRRPSTLILIPANEPHSTHFVEPVRTLEIELAPSWAEHIRRV